MERIVPDFSLMKPQQIKNFIRDELMWCLGSRDMILRSIALDRRKSVRDLAEWFVQAEARHQAETVRVRTMFEFDRRYGSLVAGVDEVGRGPLAGPIVGAAVILKDVSFDEELLLGINDSKKLSSKKRRELAPLIRERALSWAVFEHSSQNIDELGIAFCNNDIFLQALTKLTVAPEIVLSDGFPVRGWRGRNEKVIQGDAKSAAIACASILAKVYRDDLMEQLDEVYPGYGFKGNVGYGSQEHIAAIKNQGPCRIHRRSFLSRILDESGQ